MRIPDRPLPNFAALNGTAGRGAYSGRAGAPKEPCSVASEPGGPLCGVISSPGSRRRVANQAVFVVSSTPKCDAGCESQPRLVQNATVKKTSLLTPKLKQFIDRVVVPILVKEYVTAETSSGKGLQA